MDKCFENCKYATFCVASNNEGQRSKGAYCSFGAGFELPDTVVCKICNQFRKGEELSAPCEHERCSLKCEPGGNAIVFYCNESEQKLEQVRGLITGLDTGQCGTTVRQFVLNMQAVCDIVGVDDRVFDRLRGL